MPNIVAMKDGVQLTFVPKRDPLAARFGGVDRAPAIRVRQLLKTALRRDGLVCVDVNHPDPKFVQQILTGGDDAVSQTAQAA